MLKDGLRSIGIFPKAVAKLPMHYRSPEEFKSRVDHAPKISTSEKQNKLFWKF